MANELATAYVSLAVSGKGLRGQVDQALGAASKDGEKRGRGLGGLVAAGFGKAAKVGFAGAGVLAGTALAKGFGRLKGLEEAEAKMRGLGYNTKEVDVIMDGALKSVKGTAFGLDDAATVAAGAVAAGIKPGKELDGVLSTIANSSAAAGIDMGSMGSIFNKVASAGRAYQGDLNQVADRGIPIYAELAKQFGVSQEEVRKMASAGEVSFEDFATAMENASGSVAKEMGNTVSGSWANFMASLGRIGAGVLSGIYPKIAPALQKLTKMLGPLEEGAAGAGAAIGTGLGKAVDFVGRGFNWLTSSSDAKGFFSGVGDVVRAVVPHVRSVASAVGRFLVDGFKALAPYVKTFASQMAALWPAVVALGKAIGEYLVEYYKQLVPYVKIAAAVIGAIFVGALTVLPPIIKAVVAVARRFFEILKPFAPVIAGVAAALVLFNLALAANPITIVVVAILALVGALVHLYKNNEKARKIMQAAWRGIKAAASAVVGWFKKYAVPAFRQVFQDAGKLARWLWQNAIRPAFRGIAAVAKWLFNNVLKPTFAAGVVVFRVLAKVARWLWNNAIRPAFRGIAAVVKWLYGQLRAHFVRIGAVFRTLAKVGKWLWQNGIRPAFRGIAAVAKWLWTNGIRPAFRGIRAAIQAVVKWVRGTAWPWMRGAFRNIAKVAKWLWTNGIRPAWRGIRSGIQAVVKWIRGTAWPWIRGAFRSIAKVAKWLWGQVRKWWNNLRNNIGVVVAFIRNKVWPRIRGAFTNIANRAKWLWERIKSAFQSIRDRISSVTNFIREKIVSRIRNAFGRIKDRAEWMRDKLKAAFDRVKKFASDLRDRILKVRDGIRQGWAKIRGYITSPLKKALGWLQRNFVGKLRGFIGKIPGVSQFIPNISIPRGWARGGWTGAGSTYQPAGIVHADEFVVKKSSRRKFERDNPGALDHINRTGSLPFHPSGYADGGLVGGVPGYARGGMVYQDMARWFRANFPRDRITSSYRPGSRTAASGRLSYHARGKALDMSPRMEIFNKIKRTFGTAIRELIFSPAGGRQVLNGRNHRYTGITRAMHFDHVHWAMNSMKNVKGLLGSLSGGGGGFDLPDWAANPLKWAKDKIAAATSGFKSKAESFGIAGKVFPAVFDKVQGAIKSKLESAASMFDFGGGPGMDVSGLAKGPVVAQVQKVAKRYGWGSGAQWDAIKWIVNKESSWNPRAANPTSSARGLFQKMTHIHGPVEKTAAGQANWGLNYIRGRYGTPTKAQAFWRRNNWYADGGLVKAPVFDNGGTLAPGLNLVDNKLGRAEPLVRPEQYGMSGPVVVNVLDRDGSFVERMRGEIAADKKQARTISRLGR